MRRPVILGALAVAVLGLPAAVAAQAPTLVLPKASQRATVISPRGVTPRVEPDFVGIYMRIEYRYLTGLLGESRTITDNSITMLEPDNFEVE